MNKGIVEINRRMEGEASKAFPERKQIFYHYRHMVCRHRVFFLRKSKLFYFNRIFAGKEKTWSRLRLFFFRPGFLRAGSDVAIM